MNDKNIRWLITRIFLLLAMFVGIIYATVRVSNYKTHEEKINKQVKQTNYFNTSGVLRCPNQLVGNISYHLVSLKSGWSIYNKLYFKKNNILLILEYCEKEEIHEK